ncbi:MAG: hypothetical protein R3300_07195, partial [Candidatus Promineifilaceae bacterium]|nr:hypothetical protein [Candidatus Promineifilaceae bacterium]
ALRFSWEVLVRLGQVETANDVLMLAVERMKLFLEKNQDPLIQEMYLAQPHHYVLWQAWQERN